MNKINFLLISTARDARGITQKELADKLKITQGTLSKIENGFLEITDDLLYKISLILRFPTQFFYNSSNVYASGINLYRKNQSIGTKKLSELEAIINIYRISIQNLLRSVELDTDMMNYVDIEEEDLTPEEAALTLRDYWKIPKGPIKNVTELIERFGILVVFIDVKVKGFSGVSTKTEGRPIHIIFINKNMPGDRIRFTIAHELGHIVMHKLRTFKSEEEANRFASEFLMPSHEIISQLENLDIQRLANLKLYWKTAMSSILVKAKEIGAISKSKYHYLWTIMGKKGYRTEEPIEFSIPQELPSLINEIIDLYFNELEYNVGEISLLSGLHVEEFKEIYLPDKNKLKLIGYKKSS